MPRQKTCAEEKIKTVENILEGKESMLQLLSG